MRRASAMLPCREWHRGCSAGREPATAAYTHGSGARNEVLQERSPDTQLPPVNAHMDSVLDREQVARRRAEFAEGCKPDHAALVLRDDHWKALRHTFSEPFQAVLERDRLFAITSLWMSRAPGTSASTASRTWFSPGVTMFALCARRPRTSPSFGSRSTRPKA